MLQLLSPLGLIALAALAIPAILHLWRPPPAVVRVGTIRFFSGPAVQRLTKLRWRELFLLAVRLLLLALLALLLTQPIWRKAPPTEPQRWALFEPGMVVQGDALKRWRDLEDLGFQARELARGFSRIAAPVNASGSPVDATDVWSLLREVDARLPRGSEVVVFASNRLASLRGERPLMRRCEVEWVSASRADGAEAVWISSVRLVKLPDASAGKLRVQIAKSTATRTHTINVDVSATPGRTALTGAVEGWSIDVSTAAGRLSARLWRADDDTPAGPPVPVVEQDAVRVAIRHSAERAEDASYVRAAIRAVSDTSGNTISLSDEIATANRIIWLSDEPPPGDLVATMQGGATLLSDAENGDATKIATTIDAEGLHVPVALFRRVPPAGDAGTAWWTDGFGAPLLTMAREGAGWRARFFSRFHPEWNDLPRSSALAAALQPLLLGDEDASIQEQQDQRDVDPSQAPPAEGATRNEVGEIALPATAEVVDLHTALWLACIALFAAERALSHRATAARRMEPSQTPVQREPALAEHA